MPEFLADNHSFANAQFVEEGFAMAVLSRKQQLFVLASRSQLL